MTADPYRDRSAWLGVASALGDHLCRTAIESEGYVTWVGALDEGVDAGSPRPVFGTLSFDLYAGTSGVGLFLAELFHHVPDPVYREAALGAIALALERCSEIAPDRRLGFYTGWVGIAYAAARAGRLFRCTELMEKAGALAARLAQDGEESISLDVVSGIAGAVPALISLAGWLEHPRLLELAGRLGDDLLTLTPWRLDHQRRVSDDVGSPGVGTGFAHGAAGISWSLFELYHALGEPRFLKAGQEIVQYENQWFQADQDNWADLRVRRVDVGRVFCNTAWCHGAPGIGLSRLRAWQVHLAPDYRSDAESAVRSTLVRLSRNDAGLDSDFSLCHGLAGIGDFLLTAAEKLDLEVARRGAQIIAGKGEVRHGSGANPWPCGLLHGVSPSLMLGLAGIGYFYLRLASQDVPSVLAVAPPSV